MPAKEPLQDYEVSDLGNVRRRINQDHPERKRPYHYHRLIDDGVGTVRVQLKSGKKIVSRLVYQTFVGELVDGLVIAHKDGDYTNNIPSNLEQVTQKENISHKRMHGTWQACEKHPMARKHHSYETACDIRRCLAGAKRTKTGRLAKGEVTRISQMFNVSKHFVSDIHNKGAWKKW